MSFFLGAILTLITLAIIDKTLATQIQSVSTPLMVLTLIFGLYQLQQGRESIDTSKKSIDDNKNALIATHDWNRRQLAITEAYKTVSAVMDNISKIDNEIKYSEKKLSDRYEIKDLHHFFCEKDNNGKLIKDDDNRCKINPDKRYIRQYVVEMLNQYDKLALGVFNKTYDEQIIKEACQGVMIKAYKVFELYIKHLRKYFDRETLYIDLQNLVTKWEREEIPLTDKRLKTEDS